MFKKMNNIYNNLNDINNMGHVFKVSDDIVYARGLLRVQMSEMVKFELEKKRLFGRDKDLRLSVKRRKVIKRYYYQSNSGLGKEKFIDLVKAGGEKILTMPKLINKVANDYVNMFSNTITTTNISNIIKKILNMSSKNVKNIITNNGQEKVPYDHRGIADGLKINENNEVILTVFSSVTSKSNHKIDLDLSPKENIFVKKYITEIKFGLPTISMPENKTIILENNFSMQYKGMIKTPVIDKGIMIGNKNTIKMPEGLGKELQERNKGAMEAIG
jgi:hypothetical protein